MLRPNWGSGESRDRTGDLSLFRAPLYQLSYLTVCRCTALSYHKAPSVRRQSLPSWLRISRVSAKSRLIDIVRDAGHAISLAHQRRPPRSDQHATSERDHGLRRTIRPLEEMHLADPLAGLDGLTERHQRLVQARLGSETVVFFFQGLDPASRRQAKL